jgi:hypothetical protein
MLSKLTHSIKNDTTMKRYAVFASKTKEAQKEGDYTIWHYLNSTNDAAEAIHWRQGALEHKDYDMVVIVAPVQLDIDAGFSSEVGY